MTTGAPHRRRAGRQFLSGARGRRAAGTGASTRPPGHSRRRAVEVRSHRHTRRLGPLALAAGLVLAACTSRAPTGGVTADAGLGTVTHVVDGDTVDVRIGTTTERIRLIGVDTPESVAPDRPVQCFGKEASDFLATVLPVGTEVRLERDAVARDRYGRLLAYVYRVEDGLLVNLSLVEHGYADAVTFGDNEALFDLLVAAEVDARDAGRGLWSACGGPDVDLATAPN